ncbi:hypothetical protein D3C81_1989230 [compost metagenome]
MGLDFCGQTEGRGNGVLSVQALVVKLLVVDIKQRVTDRAIQQRTLAIQRLILQPRQRAGLGHHADMQTPVEHALFHFVGRDHANLDLHVRPAFL